MKTILLNNGVEMPVLGYGVYLVSPEECERCVLEAIGTGYRLIDTAQAYYNEEGVGAAVSKCGVPRSELFLTTKVWISNAGDRRISPQVGNGLYRPVARPPAFRRLLRDLPCNGEGLPEWQGAGHRSK